MNVQLVRSLLMCSTVLLPVFLARDVIYTSRAYATMSVSVCLPSVRLSVTEMHWRIIANLGYKFQSQFTAHCGCGACGREGKDHLALCLPLLGPLVDILIKQPVEVTGNITTR